MQFWVDDFDMPIPFGRVYAIRRDIERQYLRLIRDGNTTLDDCFITAIYHLKYLSMIQFDETHTHTKQPRIQNHIIILIILNMFLLLIVFKRNETNG